MFWLLWVILVGLIAGWAAGKIMKGSGYGTLTNILLGVVGAMVGCGLGMLLILYLWTREHGIQLKVTEPTARVRQSLGRMRSTAAVKIAGIGEALSMLSWGAEEFWDSSRMAA